MRVKCIGTGTTNYYITGTSYRYQLLVIGKMGNNNNNSLQAVKSEPIEEHEEYHIGKQPWLLWHSR